MFKTIGVFILFVDKMVQRLWLNKLILIQYKMNK